MSTGEQMLTNGNNDKLWDEVTEDENLQQLLAGMLWQNGPAFIEAARKVASWLENNIAGCGAEVVTGRLYLSNGDPGYPSEYCDNPVAPGRGEYCDIHEEE